MSILEYSPCCAATQPVMLCYTLYYILLHYILLFAEPKKLALWLAKKLRFLGQALLGTYLGITKGCPRSLGWKARKVLDHGECRGSPWFPMVPHGSPWFAMVRRSLSNAQQRVAHATLEGPCELKLCLRLHLQWGHRKSAWIGDNSWWGWSEQLWCGTSRGSGTSEIAKLFDGELLWSWWCRTRKRG